MHTVLVDDIPALIMKLRERVSAESTRIIAIDGATGVGKSTLAERLAEAFAASHLKLDDFRTCDGATYVARTDIHRLNTGIEAATRANRLAIVDGVCVLSVLSRAGRTPDVTIFAMPSPNSVESDFLDDTLDLEAVFEGFSRGESYELDREIAVYQRTIQPHFKADFQIHVRRET